MFFGDEIFLRRLDGDMLRFHIDDILIINKNNE
jgi:hypothetical protein